MCRLPAASLSKGKANMSEEIPYFALDWSPLEGLEDVPMDEDLQDTLLQLDALGVLEWLVIGKVTEYGQNVTLFCNVSNCCPKDSGWDMWTPQQRTLFIDVKSGRPNKTIRSTPPYFPTGHSKLSPGEIASIITGITMVIVLLLICIHLWIRRKKRLEKEEPSDLEEKNNENGK
ncbi:unnamed protein product [Mytilus edulis]|uniref:Uncharacterized protein n=1 Tax=Mytilus edulis TaxID=6550 RepID=A0A8S3UC69_MYTED|nr:unnamed protein product [Mytilus edulis]